MLPEAPAPTAEVKEEGSVAPEDSIIAAEPSPAAGSPTQPQSGISKELTEVFNGVVRRLTEYRDKEYGPCDALVT